MVEGTVVNSEVLLGLAIALGVIVTALIILLLMEREKRKPLTNEPLEPSRSRTLSDLPFNVRRTVTEDMFKEARDKLRLLGLEREILSYAIRRLYEASAEGKITEAERDRLALKYKMDLARIKEEIARGESIVALNELEKMQEEFIQLFQERFEELNRRIEELRAISGFTAPKSEESIKPEEPKKTAEASTEEALEEKETEEEKTETKKQPAAKKASPKPRRKTVKVKPPPEPERGDAEEKVARIVAEVEKVLEKLGQMEVEE
ncbi:hypothetical protein CW712_00825 [Candidatus Bathyarchaeota archaeon]|nr:MAG: hypothetical protein CW712_00825 [Candidatus Bathyarchaeota archaeon]